MQELVFRCQGGTAKKTRYNALVKFWTLTVTKVGRSATLGALICTLTTWLETGASPTANTNQEYSSTTHHDAYQNMLQHAIVSQTQIGWQYATRGFISTQWTALQAHKQKIPEAKVQVTWTPKVLQALWLFGDTMRQQQNGKLNSRVPQSIEIKESSINEKIKYLYKISTPLQSQIQRLFDLPLELQLSI